MNASPEPRTPNPEPRTLNPGHRTPDPTPEPPNPGPRTLSARLNKHVLEQTLERRLGTLLSEVPGILHERLQFLVELRHSSVIDLAGFLHLHPEYHDRVA